MYLLYSCLVSYVCAAKSCHSDRFVSKIIVDQTYFSHNVTMEFIPRLELTCLSEHFQMINLIVF
jgi:hypothetical protein